VLDEDAASGELVAVLAVDVELADDGVAVDVSVDLVLLDVDSVTTAPPLVKLVVEVESGVNDELVSLPEF
jgi:hypothetical protein